MDELHFLYSFTNVTENNNQVPTADVQADQI